KSLRNGRLLVDIARRAEELGFSTLGTIGRASYPTYEEVVTLGAAAAVTQRIGLMTDILLAATRERVLLAKQAATLDQISGGRFILGIGAGRREDGVTGSGRGLRAGGRRRDAARRSRPRRTPRRACRRSRRSAATSSSSSCLRRRSSRRRGWRKRFCRKATPPHSWRGRGR